MEKYILTQGDQNRIFFKVIIGTALFEDNSVENIEICIGNHIRKTLLDGEVFYHNDVQSFSFVLSQEDTMWLPPGPHFSKIRVKLLDFDGTHSNLIHTMDGPCFEILPGLSKETI